MFERLGSAAFRFRFAILVVWVAAAMAALAFAPSLTKVGSTDQSSFLPATTESIRARDVLERAFPKEVSAGVATIAFGRASGLTAADGAYIGQVAAWVVGSDAPAALRDVISSVQTPETSPELASIMRSPDGSLELMTVNLTVSSMAGGAGGAVEALRAHLETTAPDGLDAHVTGSAGVSLDYMNAILRGTDSTLLVTIVLVIAILLLVYRAPLAALVPLATIGAAFLVSRGLLGYLAQSGWKISSLLDTFVVVLVFGVGTDYTIFLISRFREEVGRGDWHAASKATVKRIGAVIAASAATVIVGLGSMAFGEFGMIQTTGPALALAIFVTLLAGLTLTPALLGIFGHYLFWPMHERDESSVNPRSLFARLAAAVSRRPAVVAGALVVALLVPVAGIPGIRTNFDAISDLPAGSDARAGFDLVATHLGKGKIMPVNGVIASGAGMNLLDPVSLAGIRDATSALAATTGVQSVTSLVSPTGDGTVPDGYVPSRQLETMADGFVSSGGGLEALLEPKVATSLQSAANYVAALRASFPDVASSEPYATVQADLQVAPELIEQLRGAGSSPSMALLQGIASTFGRLPSDLRALAALYAALPDDLFIPTTLAGDGGAKVRAAAAAFLSTDGTVARFFIITADDPYSIPAFETVRRARQVLDPRASAFGNEARAFVGGPTAELADTQTALNSDFERVAVITVLGVLVVLILLLRAIVAPVYLVLTVLLSYLSTLGLTSWLYQSVFGQPGVNFFLPLMVFVLLVALGSDYNIFLMSRVREESRERPIREGIRVASGRTGAVITSAGLILAGTFGSMASAPLVVLFQIGVAVGIGVLIDTFVVRSILVPALTTLVGDRAWWPSRRDGNGSS